MQSQSAEVEEMLTERAFIESRLGGVRNAELHNTCALVQHNLVPRPAECRWLEDRLVSNWMKKEHRDEVRMCIDNGAAAGGPRESERQRSHASAAGGAPDSSAWREVHHASCRPTQLQGLLPLSLMAFAAESSDPS